MQNIVLIGDTRSGKSAFVRHLKGKPFVESFTTTIGKDLYFISDSLVLHDMGGISRFESIRKPYYQHASGIIVFYDMSKTTTIEPWLKEIGDVDVPIIVVGNKKDISTSQVKTTYPHVNISIKENTNVDKVLPLIKLKAPKVSHLSWIQSIVNHYNRQYNTICSVQ